MRMNADKILSKVSNGDKLTDKELLYARNLFSEAFHLGVRLGARGDMLRRWAAADLYAVEGYLRNRGVEFGSQKKDWKKDQKSLAKEVVQWGQEDLAQHEIVQFLRYLQACGGHAAPFDLKAHLPRIQRLLDAHEQSKQRGGK